MLSLTVVRDFPPAIEHVPGGKPTEVTRAGEIEWGGHLGRATEESWLDRELQLHVSEAREVGMVEFLAVDGVKVLERQPDFLRQDDLCLALDRLDRLGTPRRCLQRYPHDRPCFAVGLH